MCAHYGGQRGVRIAGRGGSGCTRSTMRTKVCIARSMSMAKDYSEDG
jgi:hypothetical protein